MKFYSVRFVFPTKCVTFNKDTEYEFKDSMKDFFTDSMEEALLLDPKNYDYIDLIGVKSYYRVISKYNECGRVWIKQCENKTFYL